MRLLNTKTFEFATFESPRDLLPSDVTPYAILSHTWGATEVTHKELRKGRPPAGPGLRKIENFCNLAAENGLEWAWIDTCCIDKRSSQELSESINSMYDWYAQSDRCFVYLSDFELSPEEAHFRTTFADDVWLEKGWPAVRERFQKSEWFTRGWTLQEMLAPVDHNESGHFVIFLDAHWHRLGTLTQLASEISEITGIDLYYLNLGAFINSLHDSVAERMMAQIEPRAPLRAASVAMKMSWIAGRLTSRDEDMAYCMLGLFGVNMPLLYGEGTEKAFQRLQVLIMAETGDESMFAWACPDKVRPGLSDLLASLPGDYKSCGDVLPGLFSMPSRRRFVKSDNLMMVTVPEQHFFNGGDSILLYINCRTKDRLNDAMCILLRYDKRKGAYERDWDIPDGSKLAEFPTCSLQTLRRDIEGVSRTICVQQERRTDGWFNVPDEAVEIQKILSSTST